LRLEIENQQGILKIKTLKTSVFWCTLERMKRATTLSPKTKHQRVRELLRAQLAEGRYPPGSRLPTETELPKLLKAGKQTIVRALNDLVRDGLIVRRRGDGTYVADRKNPPLIAGRHLRIGILWHRSVMPERLLTYFQGAMTRGALSAWGLENVEPTFARVGDRETTRAVWTSTERGITVECIGESVYSRERHPDLAAVKAGRFDALLVLSIIEEPWLEDVFALGIPTVLVDVASERKAMRTDSVLVDPGPGYRAAVERFVSKGLQRIFFVGGYMGVPTPSADMTPEAANAFQAGKERIDPDSFIRLSAYRQAMDACGLRYHEHWVSFAWYQKEHMDALTAQYFALPEGERPQAVICHNIDQARLLMEAFADRGAWLDAAGAAEILMSGPASVIRIDGTELGQSAAALVISRLQQPTRPPLHVGVPMRLLTSESETPRPTAALAH
jgi:DNA-binding LacI/PurR family transcriptional regulator